MHSLNSFDSYEISKLEDEIFNEIKTRILNLGLKYLIERLNDGSIRFMINKHSNNIQVLISIFIKYNILYKLCLFIYQLRFYP